MILLIVDDEEVAVQCMVQKIDWVGSGIDKIIIAYNVQEAKERISEGGVDLILCDIEMPADSGINFMRWVRQQNINTPCFFLTCHAEFNYAQEAIQLGCKDYILKPAPYELIGAKIRQIVDELTEYRSTQQVQELGRHFVDNKMQDLTEGFGKRKTTEQLADEIEKYIMLELDSQDLTLSKIATHFFMNKDYINRVFQKEKQIPLGKFITRQRMLLAAQLLLCEKGNAAAIATKVGFSNYSHFVSTFRKAFHRSPTAYKGEQLVDQD